MWVAVNLVEIVQQDFRLQGFFFRIKHCKHNLLGWVKTLVSEAAHVRICFWGHPGAALAYISTPPLLVGIVHIVPFSRHLILV